MRADTRRINTESWAKYFISTDSDIKLVTKKLFSIIFFLVLCHLQSLTFFFFFLHNLLLNFGLEKRKDN